MRRLQLTDRQQIERMLGHGETLAVIADVTGFSKNCVKREIKKNPHPYDAIAAQAGADLRRKNSVKPGLQKATANNYKKHHPKKIKCPRCHDAGILSIWRGGAKIPLVIPCPLACKNSGGHLVDPIAIT